MNIGQYLKSLREQRQLSSAEVGRLSEGNISQGYVSQIESSVRVPSVGKLKVLADLYEADIHDLVDVMTTLTGKKKVQPFTLSDDEKKLIEKTRKMPKSKRAALFELFL